MEAPTHLIKMTEESPTTRQLPDNRWETIYYPTKIRWSPKHYNRNRIVYNFGGTWKTKLKIPREKDLGRLMKSLSRFNPVELGPSLSLSDCVRQIANCDLFLSICNGMSHMCHSVGTPIFLLEHIRNIACFHRNKEVRICRGIKMAHIRILSFLESEFKSDFIERRKAARAKVMCQA